MTRLYYFYEGSPHKKKTIFNIYDMTLILIFSFADIKIDVIK